MAKSTYIENVFRSQDKYADRGKYVFSVLGDAFSSQNDGRITDEEVFAFFRERYGQKYSLMNAEDNRQNIKRRIDTAADRQETDNIKKKSRRNINNEIMKEQLTSIAKTLQEDNITSISYCDVGAGDCVRSFVFAKQMSDAGLWVDKLTMFDFASWNQYDDDVRKYALNLIHSKKSIETVEFVEIEEGIDYDVSMGSFNVMTLFYVTHHMDNAALRFFIKQARRLVPKGGYLILKDHNLDDDINIALCQVQHLAYKYLNDENQNDDKIYSRSSKKITKTLGEGGFDLVSSYKEPEGVNSIVHVYVRSQQHAK